MEETLVEASLDLACRRELRVGVIVGPGWVNKAFIET